MKIQINNTHHQPYSIPEQQPARTKESARDRYWKQAGALQAKPNLLELYPNPTAGQVRAQYQLAETAGFIVVQSLLGQPVLTKALSTKAATLEFSTANLAEGMYYYSVFSGGNKVGSGKLSIMH